MENTVKKIVCINREYAGIAEAGGVKGVVRALCEQCVLLGIEVTAIIPLYACSVLSRLQDYRQNVHAETSVKVGSAIYTVSYSAGFFAGVRIVFVENPVFAKLRAPYTYTQEDETENGGHVKGTGFEDAQLINVLFQKAALSFCAEDPPDIMQCHDAPCALVPALARELDEYKGAFTKTAFMVTIHNAGPSYHHEFYNTGEAFFYSGLSDETLSTSLNGGRIEPYLTAARHAMLTTVSPWYAEEIQEPRENDKTDGLSYCFKHAGIKIAGIVNGIDTVSYNTKDRAHSLLPAQYDPASGDLDGKIECRNYFLSIVKDGAADFPGIDVFGKIDTTELCASGEKPVYVAYHGRLVYQKGIWVLCEAIRTILYHNKNKNIFFSVNGQGERALENEMVKIAEQFPGRIVYCRGYEKRFSRICTAAADFSVLPSIFEPCGTEDFIAQLFGTIPVAHATGGLQKIIDGQTGFLYKRDEDLTPLLLSLADDFHKNPAKYLNIVSLAATHVAKHYSWAHIASAHYLPVYNDMLRKLRV